MLKCLNNKHGFSMIELLVVISIIGIIAAIFLPSYNKARNSKELLLAREQIAGDIRMAQNYSYNVLKFNGSFPKGGYGVNFDIKKKKKKYIIFADINSNQKHDALETFQEMDLPRSVEISGLKIDGASTANPVDVVFKPPYGNVYITSSSSIYTELEIEIKNSDGETKIIKTNDSRLISF